MTALPPSIQITEVGPRDGLQNEARPIDTAIKIAFVEALIDAGCTEIEITSFVNPKWVPQLADAAEVLGAIPARDGLTRLALVPNEKGLDRALEVGVDKIAVFTAASETFSQKNTNATIEQTLTRFAPVIRRAGEASIPVRAYVSCVVACPYEGPIDPSSVRDVSARLLDLGADEIDLGETIGVAEVGDIERLYEGLDGLLAPSATTLHLHNTRGRALECARRAMELGVHRFDASCAGLGGCPYAPGAAGNVATEDLVRMAEASGVATGLDLEGLERAGAIVAAAL